MTDRWLTDELAQRALGWHPTRDRYVKPGRSWIPRSRFQPVSDIRDALRVVHALTKQYSLWSSASGMFAAEVHIHGNVGRATGKHQARTVCLAVVDALGIGDAKRGGR